jgi:hypothetical protein
MGQLLSIPFVLVGIGFVIYARRKAKEPSEISDQSVQQGQDVYMNPESPGEGELCLVFKTG